MKRTLAILFLILCVTTAFGQLKLTKPPVNTLNGRIIYNEDMSVLSDDFITTKEELFSRALSWFKVDFPTAAKYVIQIQDKEAGKIVAKALIHYSFGPGTGDPYSLNERLQQQHDYIEYTISIHVKDGGYKYVMTDFNPLIEKAGRKIVDYGFPQNPDNSTQRIDSAKLERLKAGEYTQQMEMIAASSDNRITSLKKAMLK